jgi:predicted phage baseplate assembly protein
MPLPAPNLDDRSFQDILDEARRRIPQYCPEWTDHNLSDPGITLLELFAWMTDMLLYRLNRVPDKNHIKFLDLIGVRLEPARAATTDITFRLTAPQPDDMQIPVGTEVATVRTETRDAVSFTTDRDLVVAVPALGYVLTSRQGALFHDYRPALDDPRVGLGAFSDQPQENDGLYFGFANDLSGQILAFSLACQIEGYGVDPNDPPLTWETWDTLDGRWTTLRLEQDTTGGLNRTGVVIVHLPVAAGGTSVDGRRAFWVRCRVLRPRPGQAGYSASPRLIGVTVETLGGVVPASHAFTILDEVLGTSDGTPGQTFQLRVQPVLSRRAGETLEVTNAHGEYEPWLEVPDFGSSGADDHHFVLDDVSGTVELGPRIRSPRGLEDQHGHVPPAGRTLRFSAYRSGGGLAGNVGARTLTVMKSSLPFIESVINYGGALGGTDSEDVEHARWRSPQVLRSRDRAVTAEDFEHLARAASPAVGRARCLVLADPRGMGHGPGVVHVLLVPALMLPDGPLQPEQLELPPRVRREVAAYLDERRLLTTELVLEAPRYTWVGVEARVRARSGADRARVERQCADALYEYLHPAVGGPDRTGWPFGRELFAGELYSQLQQVSGVDVVEQVVLHTVDPVSGQKGGPQTEILLEPDGLLCSWNHEIRVQAQARQK